MLNTPVLFLVFNRPDLTERVFAKIKEAKPAKIFVAADGHRVNKAGEEELCKQTRAVVLDNIDWDCEVQTLFRDNNLGCKIAVSSAISWFFENVEEGIILEDDILPDPSFFTFCEEMLTLYKDDDRVTSVCGVNLMGQFEDNASYHFSRIFGVWGWASWKRTWMLYDGNITSWGDKQIKKEIKDFLGVKSWYDKIKGNFDLVYNQQFDTWDYQLVYAQLKNKGLSVIPGKNLVTNIGFREDATHTKHYNKEMESKMTLYDLSFPLRITEKVIPNEIYDAYYFSLIAKSESPIARLFKKGKSKLKRVVKNTFQ